MGKFIAILIAGLLAIVVLGGVALLTVEIPAPTETVEKEIPNDRFSD